MLRIARLAAAGLAALAVASCCTLPAEREAPKVRKAGLAAPQKPRARAATTVTRPKAEPVAAVSPVAPSSFPKQACRGPRATVNTAGGKIVGGKEASIGDWPGFVALRMRTELNPDHALYFCGGSAIAPRWVLTAAHCVHEKLDGQDGRGLYQDMKARWGGYGLSGKGYFEAVANADRLSAPSDPRGIRVNRVIEYPGYANVSDGKDIALLELEAPLSGPFARISLSSDTDPSDLMPTASMVAGFGRTTPMDQPMSQFSTARGGTGFALTDQLREAAVPVMRKAKCTAGDARICAAEVRYGGPDTCEADSGGPLAVFDGNSCPYVVGLTSYGPGDCGRKNSFGVYTRISAYASWIRGYVPDVATTPAPIDRAGLERTWRSVWASVGEIEKRTAALPASQRVEITLCTLDGPGCVARDAGPLQDGESYRVGASASSGRIVISVVSAQGAVRQVFPVDTAEEASGTVVAEATARWQYDEGRVVAIVLPSGAALPEVARARDAEGKVADPVAYMKELEAAALQPSATAGVIPLAVRQKQAVK